jgi:hypothetical protein
MDHSKSSGNRLFKLTPPIEPTQCTSRLPPEARCRFSALETVSEGPI